MYEATRSRYTCRGSLTWKWDDAARPFVAAGRAEWRGGEQTEFDRLWVDSPETEEEIETKLQELLELDAT